MVQASVAFATDCRKLFEIWFGARFSGFLTRCSWWIPLFRRLGLESDGTEAEPGKTPPVGSRGRVSGVAEFRYIDGEMKSFVRVDDSCGFGTLSIRGGFSSGLLRL